nr:MAG TPA: hypothetical protein [Caudoviricetes sp.]
MATKTTNYNLTKPDLNDWADIRVINNNMDIIDDAIKTISDLAGSGGGADIDLSAYALKSQLDGYLPLTGGNVTGKLTYNGVEVATVNTTKQGTKKGQEDNHWKTYLPDGRVMFKVAVGTQKHVTLPVVMANTQYSIILCDEQLWDNIAQKEKAQIVNRGVLNKSATGFDVYSCKLVGTSVYYNNYWAMSADNYIGYCDCIIIGWEV